LKTLAVEPSAFAAWLILPPQSLSAREMCSHSTSSSVNISPTIMSGDLHALGHAVAGITAVEGPEIGAIVERHAGLAACVDLVRRREGASWSDTGSEARNTRRFFAAGALDRRLRAGDLCSSTTVGRARKVISGRPT